MKQETGNNRAATEKRLSIQLQLGGHSFSQALLPREAVMSNEVVTFSVLTHKCTLVPKEVFDATDVEKYLAIEGLGCDDDECAICDFTGDDAIVVMAIDKVCLKEICDTLVGRALFVSPLSREYHTAEKDIYIYMIDGIAYFKLYDGEKLLYAEAAKVVNCHDVVYYIALLGECFDLSVFNAYIEGEQTVETAKLIRPYFQKVKCE